MHVYLSPHHDDVCYSLGHLASLRGGELVNVFTRSLYVENPAIQVPEEQEARVEFVSDLRRKEDKAFASAAGLTRHDLGFSEPRLVGFQPFEQRQLDDEVQEISARLIPFLLQLPGAASGQPEVLYAPMGIGGHRNHVSLLLAVRQAYPLLTKRYRIALYEDLQYASMTHVRRSGLARAQKVYAGFELVPLFIALDQDAAQAKLDKISLYASQHSLAPRLRDFTPATGASAGPHEAVWRVRQHEGVSSKD